VWSPSALAASLKKGITLQQSRSLRFAFLAAVAIKGLTAIESVAGAIVAIAGTQGIYDFIIRVTARSLSFICQQDRSHPPPWCAGSRACVEPFHRDLAARTRTFGSSRWRLN